MLATHKPMLKSENLRTYLAPLLKQLPEAVCPFTSFEEVASSALPTAYQHLLDHSTDMTSTLRKWFGEEISIRVLRAHREGNVYSRCVLLELVKSGRVVEFGGIDIYLDSYPEAAQRLILEEHEPLGGIITEQQIPFVSKPYCFVQVSNAVLDSVLVHEEGQALFGRCNKLSRPDGVALARIVEILPRLEA